MHARIHMRAHRGSEHWVLVNAPVEAVLMHRLAHAVHTQLLKVHLRMWVHTPISWAKGEAWCCSIPHSCTFPSMATGRDEPWSKDKVVGRVGWDGVG